MDQTLVHPNQALRDYQSEWVRRMGHAVAHWVSKTEADRLDWVPGDPETSKARTILDQIAELVNINRRQAARLRGEEVPEDVSYTNGEQAIADLKESADAFADAIAALSPEELDKVTESFIGPLSIRDQIGFSLTNIAYHGGVVNAYQLMYGDTVFHIPPTE